MPGHSLKHSAQKHWRRHLWTIAILISAAFFPPLAVAARFGIGIDFLVNLLLTICGIIPGQIHQFYINDVRNNQTDARMPKWAIRYRLVDDRKLQRKKKRSEWAQRYNQLLPEVPPKDPPEVSPKDVQDPDRPHEQAVARPNQPRLWRIEEEQYYSNGSSSSGRVGPDNLSGRWHYSANFDDVEVTGETRKSKGRDRWSRSEDAKRGVGDDGKKKKRKNSSSSSTKRTAADDAKSYRGSAAEGPEHVIRGSYGRRAWVDGGIGGGINSARIDEDDLHHQF